MTRSPTCLRTLTNPVDRTDRGFGQPGRPFRAMARPLRLFAPCPAATVSTPAAASVSTTGQPATGPIVYTAAKPVIGENAGAAARSRRGHTCRRRAFLQEALGVRCRAARGTSASIRRIPTKELRRARPLGLRAGDPRHAEEIGKLAADLEVLGAELLVFVAGALNPVVEFQVGDQQIQALLGVVLALGLLRHSIEAVRFVQDHFVLGIDLFLASALAAADALQLLPQRVPFADGLFVLGRIFGCPLREDLGLRDLRFQGAGIASGSTARSGPGPCRIRRVRPG